MKKSLTMIASAAMALSMFASVAMADTSKTTSDYKDLANLDAGLKSQIDLLLTKGIFEGVSNDTFGISQNMTRAEFAKVASLVFGLQVDTNIRTSSFTDVRSEDSANGWAIPYIEAAKKAGLIDGMTDMTFAPGENVTVGQLDTVFVKGLGKNVNVAGSPWYADAVKQATNLNIHPADKNGAAVATRTELVLGAYGSLKAIQNLKEQQQVSVSSVQASGEQAVKLILDKAADTSKATLSLTKEGTVIPTTTVWSSDKKSAVLTLSANTKLSAGSYTVTLGGLNASSIKKASGTFTISTQTTTGNTDYSNTNSYDLANVIDSGLTESATGTLGFATRAEAEDPSLSKFAKEIKLKATNASGDEVALPGIIQSISSSNPAVVRVGVSADHRGYILGNKAGTATVSFVYLTLSGETKQMSIPVHVKSDTVTGQLIKAGDASINQNVTVTSGVYSGQFNPYVQMDLKVTDNYGIEYEKEEIESYNFALATTFITENIVGDSTQGAVGTVTIDQDGTVHIIGNVTKFELTAILPNGNRAFSGVTVHKN
jgi:hypothetical protein